MANCHDEFQEFYSQIELASSKKKSLREARDAVRKKVKKYFSETMKQEGPNFCGQGSYAMSTIVNPIDGEYDIDDGVYLNNLDPDKSKWPAAETVHSWICDAVQDHTDQAPKDKRTCVRVIYAGQYHVDLPIYGMYDKNPYLAEKGESEWSLSDPKAITDWFMNEVGSKGGQLRRIVTFFKAWADNKSKLGKLPSGLVLTVLVVNNCVSSERDDISFAQTVQNIYSQMLVSPVIVSPVSPGELLSDNVAESQMSNFLDRLSELTRSAQEALEENNREEACKLWEQEFGGRFPVTENKKSINVAYPLATSDPPKPWVPE